MTVKGGTTPACAACKYQRRKCSPSCPLAPYFPANQPKMFQNVHRLFGVSNVTKTLEKLKTKDQKEDAMKSIIYEAEMRERFPVHGCSAIIVHLRHQLHFAAEELRYVYAQLDACREQLSKQVDQSPECWPPLAQFEFGSSSSHEAPMVVQKQEMVAYGVDNQFFLNENSGFSAENMVKPLLSLDPCSDTMSNNLSAIQAQMDSFGFQERNNTCSHHQDFEVICHDNFMSSSESSLEDATQLAEQGCRREPRNGAAAVEHGCRRELKTAAAGFSLTTVN